MVRVMSPTCIGITRASRILEKEHPQIRRGRHGYWSRCGSRILDVAGRRRGAIEP
jgi:hypothetical protein